MDIYEYQDIVLANNILEAADAAKWAQLFLNSWTCIITPIGNFVYGTEVNVYPCSVLLKKIIKIQ